MRASATNSSAPNSASAFRNKWRIIFAELRRGLKLAIEANGHGIAPPM
jgi:hypothetical protein